MISVVILNRANRKINNAVIERWLEETDDIIICGNGEYDDARVRFEKELNIDDDAQLLSRLDDIAKYERYFICSPTTETTRPLIDSSEEILPDKDVIMLRSACVIPGQRINLRTIDPTVFAKIYRKGIVKKAEEQGVSLKEDAIINILCMDGELLFPDNSFYYETDEKIYNAKIQIKNDRLYMKYVDRLPLDRRAANIHKWITSDTSRLGKEIRMQKALRHKTWEKQSARYSLRERVKERIKDTKDNKQSARKK